MLWFVGGIGAWLLLSRVRSERSTMVALAWLAAALLSIAINGRRLHSMAAIRRSMAAGRRKGGLT